MRSLFWLLKGILIFVAVLLQINSASANAPAPPSYVWLTFQDQAAKSVTIQGAQLVQCATVKCDRPILLMQTGICTGEDCLKAAPILGAPHRFGQRFDQRFDCAGSTCLYAESQLSQRSTGPYYQLIAQFEDRSRTSQPFPLEIQNSLAGYSARNLRVTVDATDLAIAPDTTPMKPTRWEVFWTALGLTEITELLVAALFLQSMIEQKFLIKILAAIAFINLLTFPVVWFFFPALQPFQYVTARVFGVVSLAVAIGFSVFLASRSEVTLKTLRNAWINWLLLLPVVLVIGFVAALFLGYGESLPAVSGVPSSVTLPASEVFAVGWEAWLIHRLSRDKLLLSQVIGLSLLMNAASLILGLMLLPAMQQFG